MIPPVPFPAETESRPGTPPRVLGTVGRFDLLLELASGGMAIVYLACCRDRSTGPLVAIKRPHRHLATDKTFLTMLLDEARLASAIDHPNVVKVRELGFHADEPFIVMDYVEGASLAEIRSELALTERAMDLKVALRIVLDALAGLHAAHEMKDDRGRPLGIVHRDISPHNVLVSSEGHAHVTDFGIAHATDRLQTTKTHEVKGKLAYLAPERVDQRRICTRQSDVFSMAIVLWESVVGRRLFRGDQPVDTLQEVLHGNIPRLSEAGVKVPRALDAAVARALSRDLGERYATAADFAQALERAAGPSLIASTGSVAELVLALHGERFDARDEQIRAVLQEGSAADALFGPNQAPRRQRRPLSTDPAAIAMLNALAPLAPSSRYAFGPLAPRLPLPRRRRPVAIGLAALIAAGLVVALLPRGRETRASTVTPVAAVVVTNLQAATEDAHPVAVPLPFVATQITFDGVPLSLVPASDLARVNLVITDAGTHVVVATALDGTVAAANVEIASGLARPIGPGFSTVTRPSPTAPLPSPGARRAPGTVRNGFTKLK